MPKRSVYGAATNKDAHPVPAVPVTVIPGALVVTDSLSADVIDGGTP